MASSSEVILGILEESEISRGSTIGISTRCKNIKRKFQRRMQFFLAEGGSCSYEDETIRENLNLKWAFQK